MEGIPDLDQYPSLEVPGAEGLTLPEGPVFEDISEADDLSAFADMPEIDLVDGLENTQASAMIDALNSLPPSPDLPTLTDFMNSDLAGLSEDEMEYYDGPDFDQLVEECKRPCNVIVTKLSDEEVANFTYSGPEYNHDRLSGEEQNSDTRLTIRSSRNTHKLKHKQFAEFKKNRQNFLQKKRRWSSETDNFASSNDDYQPPDSYNKERRRKKKKLAYEDDIEWNPKFDNENITWKCAKGRKSDKLRITTRRRRIETDSDSESDFDYETYMYGLDEDDAKKEPATDSNISVGEEEKQIYDPEEALKPKKKVVKKKKPKPKQSEVENSMIDNDVLSRILKEMEDYSIKHGRGNSKVVNSILNGGRSKMTSQDLSKDKSQKRKRMRIKVTKDILPPSVTTVQSLLKNMVDKVVTIENARVKSVKMKVCRWCKTEFDSKNTKDILCSICKDTVNPSLLPGLKAKKSTARKKTTFGKVKVNKAKSKIISKVMKNLPKYEQHRLQYSDKLPNDKGYSHLKTLTDPTDDAKPLELNEQEIGAAVPNLKEKVKIKKKKDKPESSKPKKSEKAKEGKIKNILKKTQSKKSAETKITVKVPGEIPTTPNRAILSKQVTQNEEKKSNNVSITNVNDGLFLMTFPSPDKRLEVKPQFTKSSLPIKTKLVTVPSSFNSVPTPVEGASSNNNQFPQRVNNAPNKDQVGSYLVPPANTVVLANYSASMSANGDYVLSGLYYQNKDPNTSNQNPSVAIASNPMSMPTVNDLAMLGQNSYATNQNAYVGLPSNANIRAPVNNISRNPVNMPGGVIVRNVQPPMMTNTSMAAPLSNISVNSVNMTGSVIVRNVSPQMNPAMNQAQLYMPNNVISNSTNQALVNNVNYPVEPNVAKLMNQYGIQITPTSTNPSSSNPYSNIPVGSSSNSSYEPDISGLINNCGLQITPANPNQQFDSSSSAMIADEISFTTINDLNSLTMTPSINENPQVISGDAFQNQGLKDSYSDLNLSNSENDSLMQIGLGSLGLNLDSQVSNLELEKSVEDNESNVLKESHETESNNASKESEKQESNSSVKKPKTSENSSLEKDYIEIQAITVFSIMDLDINPKALLLNRLEQTQKKLEELSKEKNKIEYESTQKSLEVFKLVKKWLTRFGSFTRFSENYLKVETNEPLKTPMEIKKEHIEEEEEEMPSCQFSQQASMNQQINSGDLASTIKVKTVSLNACQLNPESLLNINPIASLETQVDSISDQLNAAGVDCTTIPIPGIAPLCSNNILAPPNMTRSDFMQDSRETPSRGSGPRTPARPESAASHTDERMLTPAQIKKEKMEAMNMPTTPCPYSGNNSQTPTPAQPLGNVSSLVSPSLSEVLSQTHLTQPVTVQSHMQQVAVQNINTYRNSPMVAGPNVAPNVSLVPNPPYSNVSSYSNVNSYSNVITNQSANISIRTLPPNVSSPQLTNYVGHSGYTTHTGISSAAVNNNNSISYSYSGSPQIQSYQKQVPPNRTVPFNTNQNLSKVLMNLVSKPSNQTMNPSLSVNSSNANVIFNSGQQGGQLYMQQQQSQQLQQNPNPVYNVQQVYIPNKTPLLQQSLQQATTPVPQQSANQYVIRQNPNAVAATLAGGAVLLNNASISNSTIQQNNVYSLPNNVATSYPINQNTAIVPVSSPSNQIPPGAYLLQNDTKLPAAEAVSDMYCAMCNKVATLRCKQCAKVAYCNPSCAKTYWHTKHKMECRPLQ